MLPKIPRKNSTFIKGRPVRCRTLTIRTQKNWYEIKNPFLQQTHTQPLCRLGKCSMNILQNLHFGCPFSFIVRLNTLQTQRSYLPDKVSGHRWRPPIWTVWIHRKCGGGQVREREGKSPVACTVLYILYYVAFVLLMNIPPLIYSASNSKSWMEWKYSKAKGTNYQWIFN